MIGRALAIACLLSACGSPSESPPPPDDPPAERTAAAEAPPAEAATPPPADAATPPPAAPTEPQLANAGQAYFTDVPLVDQHGAPHRLYSDLIQGRIVVMCFFFTRCEGVCPKLNLEMSKIQDHLGDRVGKDVLLMSVSVDPSYDTPPVLAEYAEGFVPRDGWYFLTGKPDDVELALRKLGQYVEEPSAHSSIFIVGNERTGLWKKAFGLADHDELLRVVDSVVNDEGSPRSNQG